MTTTKKATVKRLITVKNAAARTKGNGAKSREGTASKYKTG